MKGSLAERRYLAFQSVIRDLVKNRYFPLIICPFLLLDRVTNFILQYGTFDKMPQLIFALCMMCFVLSALCIFVATWQAIKLSKRYRLEASAYDEHREVLGLKDKNNP